MNVTTDVLEVEGPNQKLLNKSYIFIKQRCLVRNTRNFLTPNTYAKILIILERGATMISPVYVRRKYVAKCVHKVVSVEPWTSLFGGWLLTIDSLVPDIQGVVVNAGHTRLSFNANFLSLSNPVSSDSIEAKLIDEMIKLKQDIFSGIKISSTHTWKLMNWSEYDLSWHYLDKFVWPTLVILSDRNRIQEPALPMAIADWLR